MSDQKNIQKLLETGAEIVGATAGGAIGLIAGPAGAIGGGVVGVIISKSLIEFTQRFLSKREQARVGAAASLALVGIQERRQKGENLRQDGFFITDGFERSMAEELFEGILLKCKDEYEEKKIRYITKLYENVAFDSSISSDNANQILNTAQQLSYRQFIIMALIGQNQNNKFTLRTKDYSADNFGQDFPDFSKDEQFILQDFVTLYNQGLIERVDNAAILDIYGVVPGLMKLRLIGNSYFELLALNELPILEFNFLDSLKE